MKLLIHLAAMSLLTLLAAEAKLIVRVDEPKRIGDKAVIKLTLKNTFQEKIQSARARLLLLNEQGKPVEQMSKWVIGGTKDKPALAPDASTTYNFVITAEKPFTSTKLIFSRIILQNGKLAVPQKDCEITR